MNSVNTTSGEANIENILGLSGLKGEELEDMLASIGSLIMESVILRVVAGLTDEEAAALDSYASSNPSPVELYDYMKERVPELDTLFEEESAAFREECVRILGSAPAQAAV